MENMKEYSVALCSNVYRCVAKCSDVYRWVDDDFLFKAHSFRTAFKKYHSMKPDPQSASTKSNHSMTMTMTKAWNTGIVTLIPKYDLTLVKPRPKFRVCTFAKSGTAKKKLVKVPPWTHEC